MNRSSSKGVVFHAVFGVLKFPCVEKPLLYARLLDPRSTQPTDWKFVVEFPKFP